MIQRGDDEEGGKHEDNTMISKERVKEEGSVVGYSESRPLTGCVWGGGVKEDEVVAVSSAA